MDHSALAILAANVKRLRDAEGWSQPDLARVSGVAQTTISAIENAKHKASIEKVESLARAFRMPTWALLMPDIDPALFRGNGLNKIVNAYIALPQDGRNEIARVSEREARYNIEKPPKS